MSINGIVLFHGRAEIEPKEWFYEPAISTRVQYIFISNLRMHINKLPLYSNLNTYVYHLTYITIIGLQSLNELNNTNAVTCSDKLTNCTNSCGTWTLYYTAAKNLIFAVSRVSFNIEVLIKMCKLSSSYTLIFDLFVECDL